VVTELAEAGVPVTVSCRVLGVSTSGYYEWKQRGTSARAHADAELTTTITEIHTASRGTYGAPRVHAELRLGLGIRTGADHAPDRLDDLARASRHSSRRTERSKR
jgi:hypothetical protein